MRSDSRDEYVQGIMELPAAVQRHLMEIIQEMEEDEDEEDEGGEEGAEEEENAEIVTKDEQSVAGGAGPPRTPSASAPSH